MKVKLVKSNVPTDICVCNMKKGEIAIITNWDCANAGEYIGLIVIRINNGLFVLGSDKDYWPHLFDSAKYFHNCCVRLLQPGEQIEIMEGE